MPPHVPNMHWKHVEIDGTSEAPNNTTKTTYDCTINVFDSFVFISQSLLAPVLLFGFHFHFCFHLPFLATAHLPFYYRPSSRLVPLCLHRSAYEQDWWYRLALEPLIILPRDEKASNSLKKIDLGRTAYKLCDKWDLQRILLIPAFSAKMY